jgi:hypothetical protein
VSATGNCGSSSWQQQRRQQQQQQQLGLLAVMAAQQLSWVLPCSSVQHAGMEFAAARMPNIIAKSYGMKAFSANANSHGYNKA